MVLEDGGVGGAGHEHTGGDRQNQPGTRDSLPRQRSFSSVLRCGSSCLWAGRWQENRPVQRDDARRSLSPPGTWAVPSRRDRSTTRRGSVRHVLHRDAARNRAYGRAQVAADTLALVDPHDVGPVLLPPPPRRRRASAPCVRLGRARRRRGCTARPNRGTPPGTGCSQCRPRRRPRRRPCSAGPARPTRRTPAARGRAAPIPTACPSNRGSSTARRSWSSTIRNP